MNPRKAILTSSIKYIKSPLEYPQKDVELIEDVLTCRCQFENVDITKILHSDQNEDITFLEQIKTICDNLNREKTNSYDLIVFYYSGHGVYKSDEKMSFIQISDDYHIAIDEIITIISQVKAKNKYFIIDACQSGGFSLMKSKGKSLRQFTYNSEGIYCMFGTTKDLLAFEPTTRDVITKNIRNSFFTHFIAEALNTKSTYTDNTISIKAVDDYASKKTPTYTNFDQIPFSTTQSTGYFPFGFWTEPSELSDISEWQRKEDSISSYTPSHEVQFVEYLANKITSLFNEENTLIFVSDKEALSKLSQPAKDLLNHKLDLTNKKFEEKPLINGLIANPSDKKYSFLREILELPEIEIDLQLTDEKGYTALYEAIHRFGYSSHYIMQYLFIRGYNISTKENEYLDQLMNDKSTRPEVFENIIWAFIYNMLKTKELILKAGRKESIINSILSFRLNRVIGYKLNFAGLANNFMNSYKEFSVLFLKALKTYNQYDELKKRPAFIKKEKEFLEQMPFQDNEYDDMLIILFPELYNE